jgi:hypothetical protein
MPVRRVGSAATFNAFNAPMMRVRNRPGRGTMRVSIRGEQLCFASAPQRSPRCQAATDRRTSLHGVNIAFNRSEFADRDARVRTQETRYPGGWLK